MNPSPAEKPSLVDDLQQVSRRTRRDEVRELCRQAAAEISRLAGELARVEGERASLRDAVAHVLQHFRRCLESEATVGVPFMGDDEHLAIKVLQTALNQTTPPAKEQP